MPNTNRTLRHIGWGATTLAVGAAVIAATAPTALAEVGPVTVVACPANPSSTTPCVTPTSYFVGQAYTISATYQPNLGGQSSSDPTAFAYVDAFDNGACVAGIMAVSDNDYHNYTAITWVPKTPGKHTIRVMQYGNFADATITVLDAPPGSVTVTPPAQNACHGDGTISGSAALPKIVLPSAGSSKLFPTGSFDQLFPTGSATRQ
ncbi:hypothetical protein [Nocardia sp. NPDC005825]|uniref:hypothetical protein n=1 Tax=unclassified Nocardia TaxID=2637762 RepID=UPI0033F279C4